MKKRGTTICTALSTAALIFVFGAGARVAAQAEVRIVNKYDESAKIADYPQIQSFLYKGKSPFGTLDVKAPPETAQFGKLAGVWEVENSAKFQGQWFCCWRALWAFKYTIDGFGVQDYYVQLERDLPPTVKRVGKNSTLTQLRVFLPKQKSWKIAWISNTTAYGTFTAVEKNKEMIMTPPPVEGQPKSRIVFYEIKKDSFEWRYEVFDAEQKEWERRGLISARRVL